MSRLRIAGIAAAAVGTVAAGTAAAVFAERRVVARRRTADPVASEGFGTLRSEPVTVTATDGVRLHVEVDEAPDADAAGPTVVLVHGFALNLDCWHFQRAHLRGARRTVLYDQRSHGRSERSHLDHANIDQLGHDLRAVIDAVAPDGPVVLVGHSMGGMAVIALAGHHPELFGERVVGVGLVSTTAGGLRTHRLLGRYLPDRLMSQVTSRGMALLARAPGLVDGARRSGSDIGFLVTGRFAFGGDVPPSYVEFVDEMLAETPFEVLAEFFPNFDVLDKFEALHAFEQVPTVIICGTEDALTSIGHSRKMASRIHGADLVECPGAGHMVILERAEQVNAALDRLVKEADERARGTR